MEYQHFGFRHFLIDFVHSSIQAPSFDLVRRQTGFVSRQVLLDSIFLSTFFPSQKVSFDVQCSFIYSFG